MLQAITNVTEIPMDNTRITAMEAIITPAELKDQYPLSEVAATTVRAGRQEIMDIIDKNDDRLLVIIGPCSIHDEEAAYEYAERLKELRDKYADKLAIVMRVYFEKPRTTVGWKGLIPDPDINNESNYEKGLLLARRILLKINEFGLPAGTEVLNSLTPPFFSDLVAWGAIGARTTESQIHREITSGLSFPVGIKNGTQGNTDVAINAMLAAKSPHTFLGVDDDGRMSKITTTGNQHSQLILRGGNRPNYDSLSVKEALKGLRTQGLSERIIVDCSHANSNKDHALQSVVLKYVIENRQEADYPVYGVMLESHLKEGQQREGHIDTLEYGKSITDACIGWEETEKVLQEAYDSL